MGLNHDYSVELGWRAEAIGGPRIFTYVNKDDYQSHGLPGGSCYNCHFVPVPGAQYTPGQNLVPTAPPNNLITLKFGLREVAGNWWVWVGDQWIGYLEGSFWPEPFTVSERHSYYGEVYDPGPGVTDMGNGNWGYSNQASLMKNPDAETFKNGQWHTRQETADRLWGLGDRYIGGNLSENGRNWKFGGPGTG